MSNIPYLEQLTDGETLTPTKAAALAFQVKTLADAAGPSVVYPISINNGGTGQTTQQAAINALTNSSAATTGQVLQRNSSGNAVWENKLPYKSYVALITQTGTNPPVATVLENTLGGTVVWTRSGQNWYTATLNGAFPANKTVWNSAMLNCITGGYVVQYQYLRDGNNSFSISGWSSELDGQLTDAIVDIRVYL